MIAHVAVTQNTIQLNTWAANNFTNEICSMDFSKIHQIYATSIIFIVWYGRMVTKITVHPN